MIASGGWGACISLKCLICGRSLVRNGKTAAGKQRCRRAELDAFLGWLLGSGSQAGAVSFGTARSFRRRTARCWNIAPVIPATGEIHDQVQVDGIYVGPWCCLIAIAGEHMIGWQWGDTEKKAAWAALLEPFPARWS